MKPLKVAFAALAFLVTNLVVMGYMWLITGSGELHHNLGAALWFLPLPTIAVGGYLAHLIEIGSH